MDNHDRSTGPELEACHCLRTKNDNFYYNYIFYWGFAELGILLPVTLFMAFILLSTIVLIQS